MGVAVPLKTLDKLSKIDDPSEFEAEVRRLMGNAYVEPILNKMVCAVYIENEALGTTGKLFKPTDLIKESIWQSKTMLVLRCGPAVCEDNEYQSWYGQKIKPGDWVVAKVTAATQVEVETMPCRIIEDRFIDAIVGDPRIVTS
jgi:hypothetical protein